MIVDRLKNVTHLTTQEKALVDLIEAQPDLILRASSHVLAKVAYVSPATVVRLCKKIGLSGYAEFKSMYTAEFSQYMAMREQIKTIPFNQDSKMEDILHSLPHIYQRAVNYTESMIDPNVIQACVEAIQTSEHIGIYGMGLNYPIAQMYQYKLQAIGINAVAYNTTNWSWLEQLKLKKTLSFAILISQSGRNQFIHEALKQLKSYEIKTLYIAGQKDRLSHQLATYSLFAMTGGNALELSTTLFTVSLIYLLDCLTVAMHVKYYEDIERITHQINDRRNDWLMAK